MALPFAMYRCPGASAGMSTPSGLFQMRAIDSPTPATLLSVAPFFETATYPLSPATQSCPASSATTPNRHPFVFDLSGVHVLPRSVERAT
jgi:hypothetical protein